jgi:hypothetical protein
MMISTGVTIAVIMPPAENNAQKNGSLDFFGCVCVVISHQENREQDG